MEQERNEQVQISSYFKKQWKLMIVITVTGILYNIGLLATPWFEGQFTQMILKITRQESPSGAMGKLCLFYLSVISIVQFCRFLKRYYVRVFANRTTYAMKQRIYQHLLHTSKVKFETADTGSILTKAISDVEDCAEGMRKFLTEIFDTGVALCAYVGMLVYYDVRLTLLCMIFPPLSYWLAEKMKYLVSDRVGIYKKTNGKLNAMTLDRIHNALTYRIFGVEQNRTIAYQQLLKQNEHDAVWAEIWTGAMPPIYEFISLCGVFMILYFGFQNVLQQGWKVWDIAMFTTFLSCYMKLAKKSGKAAKLVNHVQTARVSWNRIQSLLRDEEMENIPHEEHVHQIVMKDVSFSYEQKEVLKKINCVLDGPGLIGITGPVAGGKSTFGKVFLNERVYQGSILLDGKELRLLSPSQVNDRVTYLGHDMELLQGTLKENVLLGDDLDEMKYFDAAAFQDDLMKMPDGTQTVIGHDGLHLSGGQAQRLALARTLAHARSILILDDPFSAVDAETEKKLFMTLQTFAKNHLILLISHRLTYFPQCKQVIWIEDGHLTVSNHQQLSLHNEQYRKMYEVQKVEEIK